MSTPVLATKLYIPPPPPKAVFRLRLLERLNAGLDHHHKLTLISAPAGFGKTTLISEWLTSGDRPTTWLSLDEGDSDPNRFLTYLVAALQKIAPNIGAGVLEVLQSPQPPPVETVLTTLLNEITSLPDSFFMVLDDYHLIDARPVDNALTFLLEHLPPQMHLVITTREDPPLPLPRLRARGQLTELRANDLRFTTAEAAEFLNQVMGLNLSGEDLATLEDRTEGWIAGLQLAALSMQGHRDVTGFIRAFAGNHRYIVDYLVEEVLERQEASVRHFLIQTAILERLNGLLCEAVTGQPQGQARLEALERGNFFIIPLDDKRQWYRYHHLFAEVLLAHLQAEQPDQVATLHKRASGWYEQNGLANEAIHHALAARDFERAANLIEQAVPTMRQSRQEATLLGWLKALPDELLRLRPVLSLHYAGTILQTGGRLEEVEARLRDAEQWLDKNANASKEPDLAGMIVLDQAEFRDLRGLIAIYRAGSALATGDVFKTMEYARLALELLPEQDQLGRGASAGLLGLAYWNIGDLEAAHQSYNDGMERLKRAGHISDVMGLAIALADICRTQGHLHEAMTTYERVLQLATGQHPGDTRPLLRGTADMYVGMSELYLEYNDLNAAKEHLLRSQALGEFAGLPQNPYRWHVAMARLRQAQGDLEGALEMLHEAARVYVGDFFPNVRPIAALVARVWLAQGRLNEAFGWVREQGLSVKDNLNYLREFEHITLARVLLARSGTDRAEHFIQEAEDLLERLRPAAQEGERTGSLIEILLLQARTRQMQGDIRTALGPLERALTLAEPEGYVRIFVDEGPPMAQLLQEAARHKIAPAYVRQLLSALGKTEDTTPAKQDLIEPLSERELQVLRLLGSELSGPEIARELMVSLNTVNTHTRNIYTKLGVNNRRAAVHRAEELHLL